MSSMPYKWVKNVYVGDRAKKVLELSSMGIGYVIISAGKDGNQTECIAAFRIASSQPLSVSMVELLPNEADKMEKILFKRQGVPGVN